MLPLICRIDSYSCSSIQSNQVRQNGSHVVNPMLQQRGSHHRNMRSRHHGFQDVFGAVYTARNRQVGADPSIEDGDPVQPQQQFLRTAQRQAGHHFERFNIEIRLVKAVEEDQSVRAQPHPAVSPCWRSR